MHKFGKLGCGTYCRLKSHTVLGRRVVICGEIKVGEAWGPGGPGGARAHPLKIWDNWLWSNQS